MRGQQTFGTGKVRILKAVEKTGSLSQAARELDMSYRHVWSAIHAAEQRLGRPLLVRHRGGKGGGGAVLTKYAKEIMQRFERMERQVRTRVDRCFRNAFRGSNIVCE